MTDLAPAAGDSVSQPLPAPPAAPFNNGGEMARLVQLPQGVVAGNLTEPYGRARHAEALEAKSTGSAPQPSPAAAPQTAPMIAHSVSLTVQVRDLGASRTALEALLARHRGYAADLRVNTAEGSPRSLQSSLRVPDRELAAAIAELRALGRVETETQSGEEVTQLHADLVARLQNSRETEQRLRAILEQRTGKIEDVLEVEEEIARVRGEIEQMEADQKVLEHRVDFATIELQLTEQYREQLGAQSASVPMQIRNAFVAGLRHGGGTLLGILLFLEEAGPTALIWLAILAVPGVLLWRRYRRMLHRQ
jgi:flagellar motility protein MotE (MotC chaperone)